ncbi:MAG: ATP-binding protein [bacterium]|nr:ATP-binding protein [bacterium]
MASLQPIAKNKNLILESRVDIDVLVQADKDKVEQALNNLLGNSLKFTDSGSIIITSKKDGDVIKIYVTDTVMGVSQKGQQMLFGKFQQISSQQEGKPAGTGLGLYISREMIRKMGGDLWIEKSDLGMGSVFALSIPISKSLLANSVQKTIEAELVNHPDQK